VSPHYIWGYSMGQGNARIFNIISIIFLVLSILVIILVVSRLAGPAVTPQEVGAIPTVFVPPTPTASNTSPPTLPPTFTPTPTNTLTPTDSPTPTPTITTSPTITETLRATDTPSITPTPAETDTPPPTETPSGPSPTPEPTLSPFLFDLREGEVILTTNFANTAGCAWQGIGGQVFDQTGAAFNGLRVHIFGGEIDRRIDSGSNTLYGAGGWEMPVDNKINSNTYYVELESQGGTVVSPRITVTFPADCARNLALVNFIQVRDR
jgi:hypothetical protein